jgi:hypothetical protein
MQTIAGTEKSLFDLVAELRNETKQLIRQEVELAKTEVSEKVSRFGRNAAWLAVGGFVAYAGLIVFLVGLGFLLSFVLEKLGLPSALGNFIGTAVIGLIAAGIGYGILAKALSTLSQESLAPEKTLNTIQEFRGAEREKRLRARPAAAKPSSGEMESLIGATQRTLKETASELRQRLTPRYMAKQFVAQVKKHPWRSGLVAIGTSCAGFFLARRRFRHAHT